MAKISGVLNDPGRLIIINTTSGTVAYDGLKDAGSYEVTGLTETDKIVLFHNETTYEVRAYGGVVPIAE